MSRLNSSSLLNIAVNFTVSIFNVSGSRYVISSPSAVSIFSAYPTTSFDFHPSPPTFFNSLSVVPLDAHALAVRRPALVPSVIVDTTAAPSLRQTSPVALVPVESDEEACVWLPLVPVSLEVIVNPVAPQSSTPLRSLPTRPAQTVKVSTLQAFSSLLAVSLASFVANLRSSMVRVLQLLHRVVVYLVGGAVLSAADTSADRLFEWQAIATWSAVSDLCLCVVGQQLIWSISGMGK